MLVELEAAADGRRRSAFGLPPSPAAEPQDDVLRTEFDE